MRLDRRPGPEEPVLEYVWVPEQRREPAVTRLAQPAVVQVHPHTPDDTTHERAERTRRACETDDDRSGRVAEWLLQRGANPQHRKVPQVRILVRPPIRWSRFQVAGRMPTSFLES